MKIFCIGRNYADHAKELNNPVPKRPLVFSKLPSALLVNNKDFYLPNFSNNIQYEGELVLKICKNGRNVQPQFARRYYNKITIGIDFTARDIQSELKKKGHPWELAKSFDGAAPIGKFIDIGDMDVKNIDFSLHKNGSPVQIGNTRDLLFHFDYLISYISQYFIVQMGDYIFTGTPAGVGKTSIGDHFEGYIGDQKLLDCRVK